jgi:hypothetical protein
MTTPILPTPDALPLDELSIVPDWLKATPKSFDNHPGDRGDRGPRREGGGRPPGNRDRRPDRPREDRPRRPAGAAGQGPRPERRDGPRPPRGPMMEPRPPAPAPVMPAAVDVTFVPEEKGFAAMLETMKHSHRAYSLFDVAKLVLNKPERHLVKLVPKPAADGTRPLLFQIAGDEDVFLSQGEALRQAVRRQADKLCREEKKQCDPPKGNFAFVNKCGLTGALLGPPNHHDYQTTIVRHHQRKLRHMPFEDFKARIQTVRDEAVVKQWLDSKSFTFEYTCLVCPEAKPVASREEVEKHVLEAHAAQLVTSAPELQITGNGSRRLSVPGIAEAVRLAWLNERRFPLKTAQVVSDLLRKENFHFFKHGTGKGITYTSFFRLKRFETLDGLAEQMQKVVTFLRAHPDSNRKRLSENLLGNSPAEASLVKLAADLHWLVQEGYVVEFGDGKLWALDNRLPKPVAAPAEAAKPAEAGTPAAKEVPHESNASQGSPQPVADAGGTDQHGGQAGPQ